MRTARAYGRSSHTPDRFADPADYLDTEFMEGALGISAGRKQRDRSEAESHFGFVQAGPDLEERRQTVADVVDGLAAIMFEVKDLEDPIEVGGETGYEVRVVNQGTKAATNPCDTSQWVTAMRPT